MRDLPSRKAYVEQEGGVDMDGVGPWSGAAVVEDKDDTTNKMALDPNMTEAVANDRE
jgi:hypothetical protein